MFFRERLRNQRVEVFAITGSPNPNLLALSGYTHERNRIYAFDSDRIEFFASIDDIVGTCDEKTLPRISASIDSHPTSKDATAFFKFDDTVACSSNERVDLMIVLDTSGSVFNAFAEERKLAENLVQSLEPNKFEKDMQVSYPLFIHLLHIYTDPLIAGWSGQFCFRTQRPSPSSAWPHTRIGCKKDSRD